MSSRRSERGQTAVEFSLMIPVMLMFLLGIFQIGITYFDNESMQTASRDGARAGAIHSGDTAAQVYKAVDTKVRDAAVGLDTSASKLVISAACEPDPTDCKQNDMLVVTVKYPWKIGVMAFSQSGTLSTTTKLRME
jgi:Flp pilus assembly protein TadG